MNEKYVQLEIWDLLEEAKLEPLEVQWHLLWEGLDASLINLEASEQLQVASEALLQMVEVFHIRSMEAFEELEVYTSDDGPVMGNGDFLPFVRQFMDIDFDEFIEPLVNTIRKPYAYTEDDERQSIVKVVETEDLLEIIEEYHDTSSQPEAIEIAYRENVSDWVEVITNYFFMSRQDSITWSELNQNLNLFPVEIFLGLLLGNFSFNQIQNKSSSFYDSEILIEIDS